MWKEKVQEYEGQIIDDLKGLLSIESVRDDSKASDETPVGRPRQALDYMYEIAQEMVFLPMM